MELVKDVLTTHVNFIITVITVSEGEKRGINFVLPLIHNDCNQSTSKIYYDI
jgi:hypothetical protein